MEMSDEPNILGKHEIFIRLAHLTGNPAAIISSLNFCADFTDLVASSAPGDFRSGWNHPNLQEIKGALVSVFDLVLTWIQYHQQVDDAAATEYDGNFK